MILLLDHEDSFVFTLARYVEELGEAPMVCRDDALTLRRFARWRRRTSSSPRDRGGRRSAHSHSTSCARSAPPRRFSASVWVTK